MILYHVTARKNLDSIRKFGLIPAYTKGLTCHASDRKPVVWLTDNPEYILLTQAGEEWIKENNPIVIEVNCEELNIKPYVSYVTSIVAKHEYYYAGTIKQHFGVEE